MATTKRRNKHGNLQSRNEDDNFEIINAEDEQDAIMQYMELGEEHEVLNLVELDDDYNEIRTVL